MKHRSIILLLILSILVITESCTGNDNKPETQATSNETKNEIEMLEVTKAVLMQPQIEVKLPGDLNPWFETRIYANVKGFVKDVYVDRGSLVKKGQLLALLDAPELYSDLNKGKAKVNELKARFRASKSYYVRISETSKTQGAVSANELDIAQARMDADSADLSLANSSYESMMHIIDYLKITAPFDGIISTRGISAGALVGPLQSGSENVPPLFLIEQIDKMRLTVAIPEVYANELLSGSIAQFYVSSTPEKKYAATLARTSDKMENNVRSMLAEFDVMNKSHELKGGMFAEAYIQMKRSVPTFFVPKSAVLKSTLGVFLVNVNADKKIEWIPVHVGNTYGNMLEVFGEISEGDVYALHAGEQIKEGSVVKKIVEMKTQ
jgi:membrane fusion protein (multidrug efflux system)